MVEKLMHQQGQCQELLGQCAQQMLNTQTQANSRDTWWKTDMEEKARQTTLGRESRQDNPGRIGVKKETPRSASTRIPEREWHSSMVYHQWESVGASRAGRNSPHVEGGDGQKEKWVAVKNPQRRRWVLE